MQTAKRILIIEDDKAIARLLRDNLEFEGFVVETCDSGRDALASVKKFTPDLLLLDLMLPHGADGFDICKSLSENPTRVPVIIVSARAADLGLHEVHGARVADNPGYRTALVRITVAMNAAWNAFSLRQELSAHAPQAKVVFSVYDLGSHSLALSPALATKRGKRGFFDPPADAGEFRTLIQELCASALTPADEIS